MIPGVQRGWARETIFNTTYMQAVLPIGTQPGIFPSTALNRPAIDLGWAFTWIEPTR